MIFSWYLKAAVSTETEPNKSYDSASAQKENHKQSKFILYVTVQYLCLFLREGQYSFTKCVKY